MQHRSRKPWRRGFSNRPDTCESGEVVNGDSHFQSVRETNLGLQQGTMRNFNESEFEPQSVNPRARFPQNQPFWRPPLFNPNQPFRPPPFHPNQHFRQPPPFNPNQPFRPPPAFNPNQHFNQNHRFQQPQQFQPRPARPLHYRNWEYSKAGPSSHCGICLCYASSIIEYQYLLISYLIIEELP